MAYNYLYLVNRLCQKLNEVELTASNFTSAVGVYADFKEAINAAIRDIYQEEDNEWAFGWNEVDFTTTIGQSSYTKESNALSIDWDSFIIKRDPLSVYTLTQSLGVATVTVLAGHQLQAGDSVYITGANQSGYNGSYYVTVVSPTVFTYTVDDTTVSPATGTILMYPPYSTKKLTWIDWDTYRKEGRLERDLEMFRDDQYGIPEVVVRKPDNNFVLSPKPMRIYTVGYEYFASPTELVAYNDVPEIPERFKDVILDGAIVHGYLFRDNAEETVLAEKRYAESVNEMRRILIPAQYYMRVVD
jgi:hypothetical protein